VDKIASLKDQLPALRLVVYDEPRGISRYRFDWLKSFEEVVRLGRDFGRERPAYFEAEIEKGEAGDVALICYTSGTTGNPKGAMLTHANVLATAALFAKAEDVRREEDWLAYLPMAWVGDELYTMVLSLLVGFTVNCPESRTRRSRPASSAARVSRCRRVCVWFVRWAKSWSTGRCATSSACCARAGAIPAADRSAQTPSVSSALSA
jgi:hypothetical protein